MSKRRTNNHKNSNSLMSYFRRPSVQIGLVLIAILIVTLIALTGNGQNSNSLPSEITTTRANEIYQQNGAFFVDVRQQSEWDSFHIPGTTLIPLGELANRLNEVPKDRPIVVVCRSGNRSAQGRDILKQAGYTNVTSMAGGVADWKAQGYPIEP